MATRDELLAAIYEAPDDDAPRLVYMDYLLAAGDPQGELLALQLARRELAPDEARAARTLVHAHARAWVPGEVRDKIQPRSMYFERGFLARCVLRQSEQLTGSAQRGHPAWRTVHTIVAPGHGFGANRVLLAPELAGVRRLRLDTDGRFAPLYLRDARPKQLEVLAIDHVRDERALVASLCAATGLAGLRLLVTMWLDASAIVELARATPIRVSLNDYTPAYRRDQLRDVADRVTYDQYAVTRALFG